MRDEQKGRQHTEMMNIFTRFKARRRLHGMAVYEVETGRRLGTVKEALIRPTQGRLMGLVVRASAYETKLLPVSEFFVGRDAVMVTGSGPFSRIDLRALLRGKFDNVRGIVGSDLLTSDGTTLGRVADVYVDLRLSRVVYRIAKNLWQQVFGGGFYVPGLVASVYSTDRRRLVAPAGTAERFAAPTPGEALELWPEPVDVDAGPAPRDPAASGLQLSAAV